MHQDSWGDVGDPGECLCIAALFKEGCTPNAVQSALSGVRARCAEIWEVEPTRHPRAAISRLFLCPAGAYLALSSCSESGGCPLKPHVPIHLSSLPKDTGSPHPLFPDFVFFYWSDSHAYLVCTLTLVMKYFHSIFCFSFWSTFSASHPRFYPWAFLCFPSFWQLGVLLKYIFFINGGIVISSVSLVCNRIYFYSKE